MIRRVLFWLFLKIKSFIFEKNLNKLWITCTWNILCFTLLHEPTHFWITYLLFCKGWFWQAFRPSTLTFELNFKFQHWHFGSMLKRYVNVEPIRIFLLIQHWHTHLYHFLWSLLSSIDPLPAMYSLLVTSVIRNI